VWLSNSRPHLNNRHNCVQRNQVATAQLRSSKPNRDSTATYALARSLLVSSIRIFRSFRLRVARNFHPINDHSSSELASQTILQTHKCNTRASFFLLFSVPQPPLKSRCIISLIARVSMRNCVALRSLAIDNPARFYLHRDRSDKRFR